MNQGRRIAGSSTALLVGNVANKVTGFLVMLTVVRLLGPDRFGLYTTVFAYVSVFALITDLGLTTVVVRRLSQDEEEGRRWLGNALLLQWFLAIVGYIACVGGAFVFYGYSERTGLIALSALSFLLSPLSTHGAVFHASMLLRIPAAISLATRLLLLLAVQWLARHGGTLGALVTVEVVLGAVNSVLVWLWSRSILRPQWTFDWLLSRTILWEGLPLFLTAAFVSLYFRIDVFFLDHYRTQAEIGTYAAAYRLTEALPLIPSAVANSIFPILCQQLHTGKHAPLEKLLRISLKIVLGAAIALAILLFFYSRTVLVALYGRTRFPGAAPLLSVLACNQILVFANILLTTLMVARGQNRSFMVLTCGMLLWNILLNAAVIPRYGALGAAWTTLATELAGTAGCLLLTSTARIFLQAMARLTIPAALCFLILAALAPEAGALTAAALWPGAAALLAYLTGVAVFRVFDSEERLLLRRSAWQ